MWRSEGGKETEDCGGGDEGLGRRERREEGEEERGLGEKMREEEDKVVVSAH